jgi:hypothetical protein
VSNGRDRHWKHRRGQQQQHGKWNTADDDHQEWKEVSTSLKKCMVLANTNLN